MMTAAVFMWKLGPTFKNLQFDEEIKRRWQKKRP